MKPTILGDETLLAIGHCDEWQVETWRKIAQAQLNDTWGKVQNYREEVAMKIFEKIEETYGLKQVYKKVREAIMSKYLKGICEEIEKVENPYGEDKIRNESLSYSAGRRSIEVFRQKILTLLRPKSSKA